MHYDVQFNECNVGVSQYVPEFMMSGLESLNGEYGLSFMGPILEMVG
jgi:hypothetical protein